MDWTQFAGNLYSDPLRWPLLASLLVLLAVSIEVFLALRKVRRQRETLRTELEERLAKLEYALQNLDPGAIERRDEDFVALLGSMLDYTESLRPMRTGAQKEK